MFIILGGDGKEYGPATADQIRAWVAGGRANLETKVKVVGTEEWRRLGDYSEFSGTGLPPAFDVPPAMGSVRPAASLPADQLADRGTRLLARIVDWFLDIIFALPGLMILGSEVLRVMPVLAQGKEPDLSQFDTKRLLLGFGVIVGCQILLTIIQAWMIAVRGQSVGKLLLKIRIVRVSGGKAGLVHGWLVREFVISVIGFIAGLVPFIGPFMIRPVLHLVDWCMIFRDDQRCLHDLLAGTQVVRA